MSRERVHARSTFHILATILRSARVACAVYLSSVGYQRDAGLPEGKERRARRNLRVAIMPANARYHRRVPCRNETLCTNRRWTHHWQPATPLRLIAPTRNDGIKRYAARIMTKLSRTSSVRVWNYQFRAFLQTARVTPSRPRFSQDPIAAEIKSEETVTRIVRRFSAVPRGTSSAIPFNSSASRSHRGARETLQSTTSLYSREDSRETRELSCSQIVKSVIRQGCSLYHPKELFCF